MCVCRYAAVFNEGGAYADVDSEAYAAIERWAPQPQCRVALALASDAAFSSVAFAAAPRHPLLAAVVDALEAAVRRREYLADAAAAAAAGTAAAPQLFTRAVLAYLRDELHFKVPDVEAAGGLRAWRAEHEEPLLVQVPSQSQTWRLLVVLRQGSREQAGKRANGNTATVSIPSVCYDTLATKMFATKMFATTCSPRKLQACDSACRVSASSTSTKRRASSRSSPCRRRRRCRRRRSRRGRAARRLQTRTRAPADPGAAPVALPAPTLKLTPAPAAYSRSDHHDPPVRLLVACSVQASAIVAAPCGAGRRCLPEALPAGWPQGCGAACRGRCRPASALTLATCAHDQQS